MDRQLLRQKLVKNLSNENINTGVSVVFKTKCELKCQNELFLKYHFSGNTKEFFRTCNVFPFSCTHLALWQGKRPKHTTVFETKM